jgi:hypothetical protein
VRKKIIVIAAANAASVLLFAVFCVIVALLANSSASQNMAKRWSADGSPYAQLSLFLDETGGITPENAYMIMARIEKAVSDSYSGDNARTPPDGSPQRRGKLWTAAYSGETSMNASNDVNYIDASVTYTGGDYFLFHPLKPVSGGYYSDDDLMKDRVVIDTLLAWQLYGAEDVAGLTLKVNGVVFLVAGVVETETGKTMAAVYGDKPRLYMPYESALRLNGGLRLTVIEACLPNPISGAGRAIFEDAASPDESRSILVDNSERFSLDGLWRIIKNYHTAGVKTNAVSLPYYENAARIAEARAALALVFAVTSLVCPALTALWLLIKAYRARKRITEKLSGLLKGLFNRVKNRLPLRRGADISS